MSRFTSTKVINSRWRNNDFVGVAGSTHTFPDQFHDEFLVDWALQISDGSIVITETPTTGVIQMSSLTVGNITLTGTATGNFGGGSGTYVSKTGDTMSGQLLVSSATTTTTVGFGDIIFAKNTSYGSIAVNAPGDNLHIRSKNAVEVIGQTGAAPVSLRAKSIGVNSSTTSPTLVDDGITFGDDVNLYRVSANALKTDDALEVVGALTNGGTSVSLSTHTHAGIGVSSVSGTLPITTSGTTAVTVAINQGSTTAVGVLQLTDSVSSTSTTTAATPNSVKTSYDLANAALATSAFAQYNQGSGNSAIVSNAPWYIFLNSHAFALGTAYFNRIVPYKNITLSNISFASAGVTSSGLTLCRFGIYTRSGTTMTLVARTASDTTIGATANTKYTRALDTTGGYPATYSMTAGSEYFLAVLSTGSTNWNAVAVGTMTNNPTGISGSVMYFKSSQTDLTATVTTVSTNNNYHYAEVS